MAKTKVDYREIKNKPVIVTEEYVDNNFLSLAGGVMTGDIIGNGSLLENVDAITLEGASKADFASADNVYTKAETNNLLSSVFTYKGSKTNYADLPTTDRKKGDVWNVVNANGGYSAGTNFAWDGSAWDALGGQTIDTSNFLVDSDRPLVTISIGNNIQTPSGGNVNIPFAGTNSSGIIDNVTFEKIQSIPTGGGGSSLEIQTNGAELNTNRDLPINFKSGRGIVVTGTPSPTTGTPSKYDINFNCDPIDLDSSWRSNFDNIMTSGLYNVGGTMDNAPHPICGNATWSSSVFSNARLEVFRVSNNIVHQRLTHWRGIYSRSRTTIWSPWLRILTCADVTNHPPLPNVDSSVLNQGTPSLSLTNKNTYIIAELNKESPLVATVILDDHELVSNGIATDEVLEFSLYISSEETENEGLDVVFESPNSLPISYSMQGYRKPDVEGVPIKNIQSVNYKMKFVPLKGSGYWQISNEIFTYPNNPR